jgi:hypothetical protein
MAHKSLQQLSRFPLDATRYLAAGKEELARAPKRPLAHALFRTARCLDPALPGLQEAIASASCALLPLVNMDPNTYSRNRVLSEEVARLKGSGGPCSIIDIGAATGNFARFLEPADDYFMVEPSINGLSGESIPLPDRSMDFAVSCHVLEHVMPEKRVAFLDSLARVARKAFIVLVPVEIGGAARVEERLRFFIDALDAKWAKEHLACTHPTLDFFREYAGRKGYALALRPVGDSCAASALVLMHHYAGLAQRKTELAMINRFFNRHYHDAMGNPAESDQYLFTFTPR